MPNDDGDGPSRRSRKELRGVDLVPVLTYVTPETKQFLLFLKALTGVNMEEAQRTAIALLALRFVGVPHSEWKSSWVSAKKEESRRRS
jgi:hypothetical protein